MRGVSVGGAGGVVLTMFGVGALQVAPVGLPPGRFAPGLLGRSEVPRVAAVLLQGLQAGDVDLLVWHGTQGGDALAQVSWEGQKKTGVICSSEFET